MKITNKKSFPDAILRAVVNDDYSKGESDFSVTELLQPPRVRALTKKHFDELEEDVEDRLWSLYGQLIHTLLDRANVNDISEKRFFASFGDKIVSCQVDTLSISDGILSDYKFTTSWGFMANRPAKPEWVGQLNMQLEILRRNNHDAKTIQIVGLLRDWQIRESKRSANYPRAQIAVMPIEIWPRDKTEAFILERIKMHLDAEINLPLCTADERWLKATGENTRCENYCLVSNYCQQFQETKPKENQWILQKHHQAVIETF